MLLCNVESGLNMIFDIKDKLIRNLEKELQNSPESKNVSFIKMFEDQYQCKVLFDDAHGGTGRVQFLNEKMLTFLLLQFGSD